ncbi:hypothetical protein BKA64DRAFT_753169 [Cadophora sp. MPI-SDFR-AT-0126]|nr:hypothetical protein BKA64DRAFT_753169 [Leotiomycetes sp. MPI-SDFR-AT-0126]
MAAHHFPNRFSDPDPDPMAVSPAYSYTGHSTPPLPPYAPSYPPTTSNMPSPFHNSPLTTQHSSSQSQTHSHSLPTLTTPFPPPLPGPPNLQIRLRPQASVFSDLDTALSQKEDQEGLPPMLDESRMVGKGRVEVEEGEEELSAREARMALDEFARNRTPYVVLASQRLQAVLGEKNTLDFELPDVPLNHTPFLHRLAANSSNQTNNLSPGFSPRNHFSSASGPDRRKDSGIGLSSRSPLSPISPWGFNQIDEKTGKGLREWLLSRGKETGTQRKRECRSISFHDFTPDMRTGEHENVLVAHYNRGGLHERADVYEVDLPTTYTDPITDLLTQGTQTWIWFLISRPILTLSPTETNTDPFPESEEWARLGIRALQPPKVIRPPPDFPMPIPTSYVVFACPASNITAYPDCKDDAAPADLSPTSTVPSIPYIHNLPPSYRLSNSNPYSRSRPRAPSTTESDTSPSQPKKIYKRKDYDFSFQGTPLFEFSSLSSPHITAPIHNPQNPHNPHHPHNPSTPNEHTFTILSIDSLGSWYPTDSSGPCTLLEYQSRLQAWEFDIENLSREERKDDDRKYRDRSAEVPHARVGKWWDMFYEDVYREESRWRRVRECMSRGKCRIVVRWVESENESSPNANAYGGGGGSGSGSGQGARKKQKMSLNLGSGSDDAEGSGDSDRDFSDGAGIGLGLTFKSGHDQGCNDNGSGKANGNVTTTGNGTRTRTDGKKIKDRLSGRRSSGAAGQTRATRNGSRRKSGLGVVTISQENLNRALVAANENGHAGVLIGIGRENGMGGVVEVDDLIDNAILKAGSGGGGVVKDRRRKK